ncbi:MAG: very short patch repair endonuclease [Aridibacter famidurans]|nr:very short patch repair endonuclease [Aridibacter famidurans]
MSNRKGQPEKRSYLRDGRAPIPEKEVTSRVMSANKAKDTKPEISFREALWSAGVRGYRLNWNKAPGRPDIAFPGRKVAVFVHGCFWHRCPSCNYPLPKSNTEFWRAKFKRNILRDQAKKEKLEALNWTVLTVWECEIKDKIRNPVRRVMKMLD